MPKKPIRAALVRGLITTILVVSHGAVSVPAIASGSGPTTLLSYGDLLRKIDAGQVTRVEIDPMQRVARVKLEGQKKGAPLQQVALFDQNMELIAKLRANKVDFEVRPSADNRAVMGMLANLLVIFLLVGGVMLLIRRSSNAPGGAGQALNFGKSRARFQMEAKTGILFDDVAGIEEAKEEL